MIKKFDKVSRIVYPLPNKRYITLQKDDKAMSGKTRYNGSPFPLLTNIEFFRNSVGEWNKELLEFGIKTRNKYNKEQLVGTHIYLSYEDRNTNRINSYLKRQYRRLCLYQKSYRITEY